MFQPLTSYSQQQSVPVVEEGTQGGRRNEKGGRTGMGDKERGYRRKGARGGKGGCAEV